MARRKSEFGPNLGSILQGAPAALVRQFLASFKRPDDTLLAPPEITEGTTNDQGKAALSAYPTGTIPVWAVDRSGRVDFSRPIRRLTEAEALTLLRPAGQPVPPTVPLPVPTQPSAARSWWHRMMEFLTGKATS